MRRIGAALAAMVMGAGMAAADPVEGIWKTEVDEGSYAHVAMTPCGDKLCGVIHRTFDSSGEYDSPNKGKVLVINMVPQGGGAYEGRVWRPSNDKVYLGRMMLEGDRLTLKGCVAGGLLCSSQSWSRLR